MKVQVIIASVNELHNVAQFKEHLTKSSHGIKLVIVDEGDEALRDKNKKTLEGISYAFYGPRERALWFSSRFGSNYERYLSVIPEKCHAETSFGFLVTYEEDADVIIELDDDVFPVNGHEIIEGHMRNLFVDKGVKVSSKHGKWYNTIENLVLNDHYQAVFPRGHPYLQEARIEDYLWEEDYNGECVLNMGLWTGHPDLDALTILYHGGLNGRCNIDSKGLKKEKVVVGEGTYFAICSMNTSFLPKIVPAFYQLYMKYMGIDRFDDIWSGIFLKKIADHLGDKVCLGKPLVYHDKRPRSVFKDLKSELEGMIINEKLWKVVDDIELNGKDYHECYSEIIGGLEASLNEFSEKLHRDFIKLQVEKMRLWLRILDIIK